MSACDRERAVEQRLGDAALSLSRIGRDPDPEYDLAVGIVQRAAAQPTIVGRGMPVAGQAIASADLGPALLPRKRQQLVRTTAEQLVQARRRQGRGGWCRPWGSAL